VGRQPEALLGTTCLAITHPDDVDENFRMISRFTEGPEMRAIYEKRYLRPDGSARWVRINAVKLAAEKADGADRMLAAVEDITERIEARGALDAAHRERELLLTAERAARSEAESAMRAKDEFLATLSHELRTPLSNVVSWAGVLKRKFAPQHPDLAKGLGIIVDNAMTQSQLISDLLDMSRIVAGKINLETVALEINEVVRAAVSSQRPIADPKGLGIEVHSEIEPGFVLGDATRLQQVLWNLLSNAIKFTPAHTATPIRVDIRKSAEHFEISVTDSGEGIDPAILGQIFGRFRQGDGSIARRHGGLGLGLAIVKQLVEMHGGQVSAHSEGAGKGARFTVWLPVYQAEIRSPLPSAHDDQDLRASQPLAGKTILVVEDQPAILEHLKQTLEEHGARVMTASSAGPALEILRDASQRPDFLVSDLGLPGIDGYQLIRMVRQELRLSDKALPAIAVSAFAREEDRVRSLLSGYQAHIVKPYRVNHIVGSVVTLLGS
jgi:PAS domain S-box-containing protein